VGKIIFSDLPRGSICLSYDADPDAGWLRRLLLKLTHGSIKQFQRNLYPHGNTGAIHAQIKVRDGPGAHWFSMTDPVGEKVWFPARPYERCRIYKWDFSDQFSEQQWLVLRTYCERLVGVPYDYAQLVAIAINGSFGWTPKLDLFKGRTVCSCAVMGALYAAWRLFPPGPEAQPFAGRCYPKPNTRTHNNSFMHIEHVPPAFFDGNEGNYQKVAEQGFGA
jgi:hypothetical protein